MSNRSVSTDALATLGTIIDETQKRDAIHLAVLPMQCKMRGCQLRPGTFLDADGDITSEASAVGIVDPFLTKPVQPGEWFWFVIKPRVITSLRHVWAHPAFPDEVGTPAQKSVDKAAAEAWLREYHKHSSFNMVSFGDMVEIAQGGRVGDISHEGDYIFVRDYDAHDSIPSEFWDHMETFTGRQFSKFDRAEYFSCSC